MVVNSGSTLEWQLGLVAAYQSRINEVIRYVASHPNSALPSSVGRQNELVSWSLTSLFSTNMAISETSRQNEYTGESWGNHAMHGLAA